MINPSFVFVSAKSLQINGSSAHKTRMARPGPEKGTNKLVTHNKFDRKSERGTPSKHSRSQDASVVRF